jgi:hypothetical protein
MALYIKEMIFFRIFSSHAGTGVAVLTTTYRFYMVTSIQEPR